MIKTKMKYIQETKSIEMNTKKSLANTKQIIKEREEKQTRYINSKVKLVILFG